jgi:hypothetical protein
MTAPFETYGRTPRGRRLASIVDAPERYAEYRAFSREGFPAVTALVSLIEPELEPLRLANRPEFHAGKQFVGWAVGAVMRGHGHIVVGRSRVPGGLFTVGAIWSAEPKPYPAQNRAA